MIITDINGGFVNISGSHFCFQDEETIIYFLDEV